MNFRPEYLGPNWETFMDYYHEDLKDLFYTFDSYDELRELLTRPVFDIKNLKRKQVEKYHEIRLKSLHQWSRVFELPIYRMPSPIIVEQNGTISKNESFVNEPDVYEFLPNATDYKEIQRRNSSLWDFM
jgi:hypothetical protein